MFLFSSPPNHAVFTLFSSTSPAGDTSVSPPVTGSSSLVQRLLASQQDLESQFCGFRRSNPAAILSVLRECVPPFRLLFSQKAREFSRTILTLNFYSKEPARRRAGSVFLQDSCERSFKEPTPFRLWSGDRVPTSQRHFSRT
jgi:hypothetical protein